MSCPVTIVIILCVFSLHQFLVCIKHNFTLTAVESTRCGVLGSSVVIFKIHTHACMYIHTYRDIHKIFLVKFVFAVILQYMLYLKSTHQTIKILVTYVTFLI